MQLRCIVRSILHSKIVSFRRQCIFVCCISGLLVGEVLADGVAFAPHVLEHQEAELVAGAAAQGVDDALVLAHGVAEAVAVEETAVVVFRGEETLPWSVAG